MIGNRDVLIDNRDVLIGNRNVLPIVGGVTRCLLVASYPSLTPVGALCPLPPRLTASASITVFPTWPTILDQMVERVHTSTSRFVCFYILSSADATDHIFNVKSAGSTVHDTGG